MHQLGPERALQLQGGSLYQLVFGAAPQKGLGG